MMHGQKNIKSKFVVYEKNSSPVFWSHAFSSRAYSQLRPYVYCFDIRYSLFKISPYKVELYMYSLFKKV